MNRIEVRLTDDGRQEVEFAEEVADHEQGDEERERQEDVGDPHQDVVEPPAAQAGEGADGDTDDRGHDRRGDQPMINETRRPKISRL